MYSGTMECAPDYYGYCLFAAVAAAIVACHISEMLDNFLISSNGSHEPYFYTKGQKLP